jgi:hypothetical protein
MFSALRYDDAHAAGGACDHAHGRFQTAGVKVGHFYFGDFADLILGDLGDLVALGNAGTLLNAAGLFQKVCDGGRFCDEGKASVGVNGDNDRNCLPMSFFVRSLNSFVKRPMLTPCWPSAGPTGGAGVALPAGIWSFTIPVTFCATV